MVGSKSLNVVMRLLCNKVFQHGQSFLQTSARNGPVDWPHPQTCSFCLLLTRSTKPQNDVVQFVYRIASSPRVWSGSHKSCAPVVANLNLKPLAAHGTGWHEHYMPRQLYVYRTPYCYFSAPLC